MKGFLLDGKGDIVISGNEIQMIDGNELLRQTVQTVEGTNKGEWFLNTEEGINFGTIFVKNPDFNAIRDEILSGLQQVDETFLLNSFEHTLDSNRKLKITFSATNSSGQTVTGAQSY